MSTSLRSIPMPIPHGAKTVLFALMLLSLSCRKEAIIVEETFTRPGENHHFIQDFFFFPELNASFLHDTISLSLNGNEISGRIPFYSNNIKSLVPSFQTNAVSVTVDGQEQQSGITALDFRKPVTYRSKGPDGQMKDYIVKLTNFTGLPVIKIHTKNEAVIDSKDNYVDAKISVDGAGTFDDFDGEMKIKGRGNYSWVLPKKPYKMKFDKKVSLFGEGEDKEWVLLASHNDNTQLNASASFFLGDISRLAFTPDIHFAELFLNDVYQGTYQLCESIKVGEARVNIPKDGYLLEVDQEERMEPGDVYFQTSRILVNIKEPAVSKDDAKYNYVRNFVTTAEDVLYSENFADPVNGYAKYLDVPSFIDWYLINEITKNQDAVFYSSCYMNLTSTGKLKMGPLWDFDQAFGNSSANEIKSPEGFYLKWSRWIVRLYADPNFVKQVAERFQHFKANDDAMLDFITVKATKLNWSAIENNKKWKTISPDVSSDAAVVQLYDKDVAEMKTWFKTRMAWLDQEFSKLK